MLSPWTDPVGDRPVLVLSNYRVRRYVTGITVDAQFPAGVNLLLGENGVGKTTLLQSLVTPGLRAEGSRASVQRNGEVGQLDSERVCLLPQRPTTPRQLNVIDLVRYCCHLRGVDSDLAGALLADLGLENLAPRRASQLSGGETQRLHLALAFVGHPTVALLDEPTVALDPVARTQFADLMRSLANERTVVVMSSHVASDIHIADHVHLLTEEGIGWAGSPSEFLTHSGSADFDEAFGQLLKVASR